MSDLYRQLRVAVINSTLDVPYHSYGDHWVDGFKDAGCKVDVFRYDQIPTLPIGYDLYFFVEIRYKPETIPWYVSPRVLYSWDAHIVGAECFKSFSVNYDKIYLASKIDVDSSNKDGIKNIEWVPEACNPRLHTDLCLDRIYEVGLVGRHNDTYKRKEYCKSDFISFLNTSKYTNFFKTEIWGESYIRIMNQALLAFDRTISYNVGTRVFESAAMGCVPLWSESGVTNDNGMSSLMKPWLHYAPYMDTIDSLIDTINFLLSHPDKIEIIRANARQHVLDNHTYAHRAVQILESMGIQYKADLKV